MGRALALDAVGGGIGCETGADAEGGGGGGTGRGAHRRGGSGQFCGGVVGLVRADKRY